MLLYMVAIERQRQNIGQKSDKTTTARYERNLFIIFTVISFGHHV